MNEDRHQFRHTHSLKTRRNAIWTLALLTFIDFKISYIQSYVITRRHIKIWGRRRYARIVQVWIRWKQEVEKICILRSISYRLIRGGKGWFTEAIRDVFGKRSEIFFIMKTKMVGALSFCEIMLSSFLIIPLQRFRAEWNISKSEGKREFFYSKQELSIFRRAHIIWGKKI